MTANAPIELAAIAVALMRNSGLRWWLVGGVALAVDAGRSWRDHADLDIAVLRVDELDDHLDRLQKTDILTAVDGHRRYVSKLSERRLTVDFVLSAGDAQCWIYRRDPTLRVAWPQAVLRNVDGVPYLAPELVLLSKRRSPRPHDELDAREVIPTLSADRTAFLAARLTSDHPWQGLLRP